MKLMFASDIHGSAFYCEALKTAWEREKPDKLVLLGDLLYHGPRNDLPKDYAPKKCIEILNSLKEEILAVRGNCEAEVDQMVLGFPCMAEYAVFYLEGRMVFVTHGHIYNNDNPPMLKKGDILLHGHTHIPVMEQVGDYIYINPGSVSIPKNGSTHNYMIYENSVFTTKTLEGEAVMSISIKEE